MLYLQAERKKTSHINRQPQTNWRDCSGGAEQEQLVHILC